MDNLKKGKDRRDESVQRGRLGRSDMDNQAILARTKNIANSFLTKSLGISSKRRKRAGKN